MFLEDPSDLIAPLEAIWSDYIERAEELERNAEQNVVEWRSAEDMSFVPNHPFYRTLNTSEASGRWMPPPIRWRYPTAIRHSLKNSSAINFSHGLKKTSCRLPRKHSVNGAAGNAERRPASNSSDDVDCIRKTASGQTVEVHFNHEKAAFSDGELQIPITFERFPE